MAQHLGQPGIFAQAVEILQAIPAQRVQHQQAFHIGRFVKPALALLQVQVLLDAARHVEGAQRTNKQRQPGVGCEHFRSGFPVVFKRQLPFRRGALRFLRQGHRSQ